MTTLIRLLVIFFCFLMSGVMSAPVWAAFFGSMIVGYLVVPEKPWEDS